MRTRTLLRFFVRGVRVTLEVKLADLWVGAFWRREQGETWHRPGIDSPVSPATETTTDVYVCLVPCVPIHLSWSRRP